jgi:hypothetical protein
MTISEDGRTASASALGSASVHDGVGVNPEGYPPKATYRFETGPRSSHIVLSTGPHTVYYSRTIHTSGQFGIGGMSTGGPTDTERIDYVKAMLQPNARSAVRLEAMERSSIACLAGATRSAVTTYGYSPFSSRQTA